MIMAADTRMSLEDWQANFIPQIWAHVARRLYEKYAAEYRAPVKESELRAVMDEAQVFGFAHADLQSDPSAVKDALEKVVRPALHHYIGC